MTKHVTDNQILDALRFQSATVYNVAAKLGVFWESGIARRLRVMHKKGMIEREKNGRFYVYRIVSSEKRNKE